MGTTDWLTSTRVAVVAGKGGVGSSTVAAAFALAAAREGADVLFVAVDGRPGMGPLLGGRELDSSDRILRKVKGAGQVRGHQLIHLFVDPSHQRMGLGRQLLLKAEATIAAAGHDTLELHVRVDNPAAIAFYERAGWVMTDRTILTIEHGISYYEYVLAEHHV